ncbi:MAG: hypothetical protein IAG13_14920 [Deltaproteobacteria bacterium]|nr:hypothetical protein [Nannocystaceae bacterium]
MRCSALVGYGVAAQLLAVALGCSLPRAQAQAQDEESPTVAKPSTPVRERVAAGPGPGRGDHFPLAYARARGQRLDNREAPIPIQCYTKTAGVSNPCWTCHTQSSYPNLRDDTELQVEYSFSEYGKQNRWANLFVDHRPAIDAIADDEALAWVREDNYSPLRELLRGQMNEWAYGFDLDFHAGFGDDGFAKDGSDWRAFRYKPFPGTFWPTNGSTDDVLVRLPASFRSEGGARALEVYKANLALVEASLASDPRLADAAVVWPIEAIDERVIDHDLDRDGTLATATVLRGLPAHYLGDAREHPLLRGTYPAGTEFIHSVRYLDPDGDALISTRMKELRYLRKEREVSRERYFSAYEGEAQEKFEGRLPLYGGNAETGLINNLGWRVQGYIEDEKGRLRLQSYEEHYACMGCHSSIGVTADSTFSFARKLPGAEGWGYQDLRDIPDVPQLGHPDPEVLTYLRRVGGGDELRANTEMIARFFPGGVLDEAEVRRAAPGGDRSLPHLVVPSRARALQLDKAYMVLVREQSFERGRDVVIDPPANVHARIDVVPTGLVEAERVYRDGTIRLDWSATSLWLAAAGG